MAIEGGAFIPGLWYDYCKDCNLWYPDKHKCPPKPPPIPLLHKLYLMWRKSDPTTLRYKLLLNAWVEELGGKVVEIDSEPLAED